ncbi:GNAT family N-acetyltransferase [Pseudaeromonas paramecii]|uniref:N-acetyltransferase domain-containing protein n=1 Tax=Pseudaeromonas paramecii TaxID=2138166 RepID=A0ABP8PYZ6_9GAMM
MEIQITPLTQATVDAWFAFFDQRAFGDNPGWAGCYCTYFFRPRPVEATGAGRSRREYARWLIDAGRLQGYLAWHEGQVVGWCNANRKSAFTALAEVEATRVLAITCFMVDPAWRGQGIADGLLTHLLVAARQQDWWWAEAYPSPRARSAAGKFHGSVAMFERHGFTAVRHGSSLLMRLPLSPPPV